MTTEKNRIAFEFAKEWGIVPEWKVGEEEKSSNTRKYRDNFNKALATMKIEYELRAKSFKRPIDPGPRPEDHDLPEIPPPLASSDECQQFARTQDNWLDVVYYPAEAERVVWETASGILRNYEIDRKIRRLERLEWIKAWAPRIAVILAGLAGAAVGLSYFV